MIIDLYRGPGGWSEGLRMLGRTDELGIDNDSNAHATAAAAGHTGICADITALDPHDFRGDVEGKISSPPCPGFSISGKGDGRKDLELLFDAIKDLAAGVNFDTVFGMVRAWQRDERSALTLEPLHWALILKPEWIALEQVPAVAPIWAAYAHVLGGLGYYWWTGFVHAEQYGVPQARKRAVLIASRRGPVVRPEPTRSRYYSADPRQVDRGYAKPVPMSGAIGWGMTGRPSMTVTGGGTDTGGPEPFGNAARKGMRREYDAGRWAGEFTTRLDVADAAALQTFRPGYPWHGGKGQQIQQIGNAVPPLMAAHILAAVGAGVLPTTQPQLATA